MLLHDAVYPGERPWGGALAHVVLTRFNMRMFREQRQIATAAALQEWFDRRLPVFAELCLPSVLQQTVLPRRWYIGVDGLHPDMATPLRRLCAPHPWIRIVPQGMEESFADTFRRAMDEDGTGGADVVVTTRLDNDDALALDHVERTEEYARAVLGRPEAPDDFWIAFPVGAQLAEGKFRLYVHTRNHFLSRVVTGDAHLTRDATALAESHSQVFRLGEPVFSPMTSTPMWLQHVHDHNVSNRALGRLLVLGPPARARRLFGLSSGPVSAPEPAATASPGDAPVSAGSPPAGG